jgi:hypothetical protein
MASGWTPQKTQSLNNSSIVGRCRGNVFTEQLPSHVRLLWLHYAGFQTSCHNTFLQNAVNFYQTIWRHFPEESIPNSHQHGNHESSSFKNDCSSINMCLASLKLLLPRKKYQYLNIYKNYVKSLKQILDSKQKTVARFSITGGSCYLKEVLRRVSL